MMERGPASEPADSEAVPLPAVHTATGFRNRADRRSALH